MLNSGWPNRECSLPLEVYAKLASSYWNAQPLMPLYQRVSDGCWYFWCPELTREGRCGDYPNRPDLCRSYEPMSDRLCVMGPPKSRWET